jgi:hypothetical protein
MHVDLTSGAIRDWHDVDFRYSRLRDIYDCACITATHPPNQGACCDCPVDKGTRTTSPPLAYPET